MKEVRKSWKLQGEIMNNIPPRLEFNIMQKVGKVRAIKY